MQISNITNDTKKIDAFYEFYKNYFPAPERDTLESMKKLSLNSATTKNWDYNIIEIKNKDSFVGGMIYDWFSDIDLLIIEYIFILENYRNQSIAKQVISNLAHKKQNATILIEVEKDAPSKDFWKKLEFSVISTDYIQPKISKNQKSFDGLILMSNKNISDLQDVLQNHYWKYSFLND